MDIAKYIGLYLLKNKYCCLQGLGNVELKKTAATHVGNELKSAAYYATLNPVGSIDDAFPNFVANNEQVSIAKASNEISEFIKESKAKIAAGGTVIIPSVGQYLQKNNQLHFELDPAFSMANTSLPFPKPEAPKPVEKVADNKEEKPYENFNSYNNYNKPSGVNWNIVAFWGVIIIIFGSIIGWGVRYFMHQQNNNVETTQQVEQAIAPPSVAPVLIDSAAKAKADSAATVVNASDTPTFKFVIKEYNNLAKAEKKQKQLSSYGYNVSVVNQDSTTFYVVSSMKILAADTAKVRDSLSRLLNPAGVSILK